MKTTKKLLAIFFVAATLVFSACSKEKEEVKPAIDLAGTSWEASVHNNTTVRGMSMVIDMQTTLDFRSANEGEFFVDLMLELPDIPGGNQHQNLSEPFTCVMKGNTLTITQVNAEGSEPESFDLTYNPADNTLMMPVPADMIEGMNPQQLLGTDKMVFHQIQR